MSTTEQVSGVKRRMRNSAELLRFILVGCLNTGLAYALYACFLFMFELHFSVASLFAMLMSICVGFVTQGALVFGNLIAGRFGKFIGCWFFIYSFNVGCIQLCVLLGAGKYLAGAMAIIPTVPLSYFLQKQLVFTKSN